MNIIRRLKLPLLLLPALLITLSTFFGLFRLASKGPTSAGQDPGGPAQFEHLDPLQVAPDGRDALELPASERSSGFSLDSLFRPAESGPAPSPTWTPAGGFDAGGSSGPGSGAGGSAGSGSGGGSAGSGGSGSSGGPGSGSGAPTSTPQPANTAPPNPTQTPTRTSRDTATPPPTLTPTKTPKPSNTPKPPDTATPFFTSTPTRTEEPEDTEEPTETPEPTEADDDHHTETAIQAREPAPRDSLLAALWQWLTRLLP